MKSITTFAILFLFVILLPNDSIEETGSLDKLYNLISPKLNHFTIIKHDEWIILQSKHEVQVYNNTNLPVNFDPKSIKEKYRMMQKVELQFRVDRFLSEDTYNAIKDLEKKLNTKVNMDKKDPKYTGWIPLQKPKFYKEFEFSIYFHSNINLSRCGIDDNDLNKEIATIRSVLYDNFKSYELKQGYYGF